MDDVKRYGSCSIGRNWINAQARPYKTLSNGLLAWRVMTSIYAAMGILSKTLSLFGKRREIAPATERRADLEDCGHRTEIGDARNEQAIGKERDLSTHQQDSIQHDAEPEREVTVVAQHDEQIGDDEQAIGEE